MARKTVVSALILALVLALVAAAPASAKKKKKKKPPAVCATYTPGEIGAEGETVVLTDAANEEAPLVHTVSLDPSIANIEGDPTKAVFNVQVDSAAPEAGLYVRMEFPAQRDYDLWLTYSDASVAASSHEWNTVYLPVVGYPPVLQGNDSHGNESSATSEAFMGIKTSDCGGYTVEVENWFGEGGDFDLSLWLGEAAIDPIPQGQEPRE